MGVMDVLFEALISVAFGVVFIVGLLWLGNWYEKRWPAKDWHPCILCGRMVFDPTASDGGFVESADVAVCRRCQKRKGIV